MTKEQFAERLDGREIGKEIIMEDHPLILENGFVVVYGSSDDNAELIWAAETNESGVKHIQEDELPCYEGGTFYFDRELIRFLNEDREDFFEFDEEDESITKKSCINSIDALWIGNENCSWAYSTSIPHAVFNIMEDGRCYCRGIVFNMKDLK